MNKIAQVLAVVPLLLAVFLLSANRVDDLDLWWHLKSGEKIVKTRSIPMTDTFSYTSGTPLRLQGVGVESNPLPNPPSDFPYWQVNLTSSWLGQVFLYWAYSWEGLQGVAVLKSIVFTLTCLVLYVAMLRAGAAPAISLLVLILVAYIGKDFNYSRPQIFSFLFFALQYLLLADWKRGGRLFFLLPPLMLVWANVHGAYVLGTAVHLLFVLGVLVYWLFGEKFGWGFFHGRYKGRPAMLVAVAGAGLLACLVNPNTFKPFLQVIAFRQSIFYSGIEEYARPMLYEYHAYWFLLLLTAVCLLTRLKYFDPADFFPLFFLAAASQMGIRTIIFFAIGAAVFVAVNITEMNNWVLQRNRIRQLPERPLLRRTLVSGILQGGVAGTIIVFLVQAWAGNSLMQFNIVEHSYPESAVAFLKQNPVNGRMFNTYNWGGYLIWKLPQHKVFIDGRGLNETAYLHYELIIAAAEGQDREGTGQLWQYLLDEYRVGFTLTNAVSGSGKVYPLMFKLMNDPGWQLIYQDGSALVFIRNSQENRERFGSMFLNKQKAVMDEIVSECLAGIERNPATWEYYANLGAIFMKRRQLQEAREMFEKYLSMNPNNRLVIQNLNFIRSLSGEKPLPLPDSPKSPHHF